MRKFILIILLLVINISLFTYLKHINNSRCTLEYTYDKVPVLINKKELSFYSKDDFIFDEYFNILCNFDTSYKFSFDGENIKINILDKEYFYPYNILEKEKDIIKEIIYKEVSKPSTVTSNIPSSSSFNNDHSNDIDIFEENVADLSDSSFTLLNSSLHYPIGTDIGTIITGISNSFISNCYVSLDYAMLNPSCQGSYPVTLYTQDGISHIITVYIQ